MPFILPAVPAEYLDINFEDSIKEYDENYGVNNLPFAASNLYSAPIKSAKFLTDGKDVKSVAEITAIIQDSNFTYIPGQNIAVLPQNNSDEVSEIVQRLHLNEDADKMCKVTVRKNCTKKNAKVPVHLTNKLSTIRQLLLNDLDIRSVPKKLFLRALSQYTSDVQEKNFLDELCSAEGSVKYNDYITNHYVSLLELLLKFPSCQPPFTLFLEHLPKLQPRQYSLVSSPNDKDINLYSEIKFTYSLEVLPNNHEGVCTGWLHKQVNAFLNELPICIPIYLRKSHDFKLPDDSATDILMVATGTGIAPFVSFLKYRDMQKSRGCQVGNMWLYYGCRYSDRDYLYKDELEAFKRSGTLTKLFTSFSKECGSCRYVQDEIKTNEIDFINYLWSSTIYVCGNKNMCKDVFDTISACMDHVKECGMEGARMILNDLKKQKKYLEDTWN